MFKKSLIALALVAAAAAPALASTDSVFGNPSPTTDQLNLAKSAITHQLQQKGINAIDVEEWGNYVRADVKLADGSTQVRFFAPDTLQPVDVNHLN
ncbi:MAG: hypothetical protein P4M09_01370 [Devosia sp.]|nr:hypothetical protein [Devosia sp.]